MKDFEYLIEYRDKYGLLVKDYKCINKEILIENHMFLVFNNASLIKNKAQRFEP